MFEVEYKAHAVDIGQIEATLRRLGADAVGVVVEEDVYFAHPGRDLAATDEALRLRTVGDRTVLTYKGPRAPGPTRARRELEVVVDGPLDEVLVALGFQVAGRVRKRRATHRLGAVTVTLDEVEGLGRFVEVEALAVDEAGRDAARVAVLDVVGRLGLGPEERRSYLEMVLAAPEP